MTEDKEQLAALGAHLYSVATQHHMAVMMERQRQVIESQREHIDEISIALQARDAALRGTRDRLVAYTSAASAFVQAWEDGRLGEPTLTRFAGFFADVLGGDVTEAEQRMQELEAALQKALRFVGILANVGSWDDANIPPTRVIDARIEIELIRQVRQARCEIKQALAAKHATEEPPR
jgi:hypothetical protein